MGSTLHFVVVGHPNCGCCFVVFLRMFVFLWFLVCLMLVCVWFLFGKLFGCCGGLLVFVCGIIIVWFLRSSSFVAGVSVVCLFLDLLVGAEFLCQ